jgi:uncharacterized protein (DUF58 family)
MSSHDKNRIVSEYLAHLHEVQIRSWKLAQEYLTGAYRSVFKGRGMDFESVRQYYAGDEVRFIDWNVTARMNAPFIKEFKEERELSVMLVVDVSSSGQWASKDQNKSELAAQVAACLAYSAVNNGDKVGLLLFTDQVERYLPPRKGRRQALKIIDELLFQQPQGKGTSIRKALTFLNQVQKRRAIVFLISDLLDEGHEQMLKVTARHHDLIPVVIGDKHEKQLPNVGWMVVQDPESGERMEVNTSSRKVRERFARAAEERAHARKHMFRRLGTETVELQTGQPYWRPLQRYMEQRLRQAYR